MIRRPPRSTRTDTLFPTRRSSDLHQRGGAHHDQEEPGAPFRRDHPRGIALVERAQLAAVRIFRSEEHTSELQSLMRISYAVFCLKKKKNISNPYNHSLSSHAHKETIIHPHTN